MTTIARALATAAFLLAAGTPIYAQTPQHAATQFLPIKNEPAPKLYVDQPLPRPLITRGVAIIPYRARTSASCPSLALAPPISHRELGTSMSASTICRGGGPMQAALARSS